MNQKFLLLRYRVSFAIIMLIGVSLASVVSVFALKTASLGLLGISPSLWICCVWYFSSYRWQLTASGVLEKHKPAPADAVSLWKWLVLASPLFLIYWLLDALGWLSRQGGGFIFLVFGSAALVLTGGVLLLIGHRKPR